MSMRKGYAGVVLFLLAVCAAGAQELAIGKVQSNLPDTGRGFTANRWAKVGKADKEESPPGTATSKSAGPGDSKSARFQLSEGTDFFRFRSPLFTANTVGIKTSGSYALNDHLGVECAVATAFGREIYDREHVKLLFVDCGPRVVLETGKIEPWVHALGGWGHEQPQTAGNRRSALSVVAGGGVDYWVRQDVALRTEVNYVRTTFFRSGQNNVQVSVGVVIRFGHR